ncbi:hypothetical protein BBO99_00007343 [Phytophthora kernoviae]|uniref:O-GlcNAc transferase C-terminal domain-containing protein n=2 Tax=Phytophthora kernoviae TaxID=325452 RepID=A0A3R7J4J4_9STRA|nr:hypothetical protein G195_008696 [Phytophthora kernoviae 00238/432]KAG2518317.1 hypothetical protein JM16_007353 [Phytophthora kernoviae]KAG2520163.1 hypothetical protein JM18_007248 [Phytophthora kernoviae]RLN37440.1 hypothetical protein BBI17_007287 [Phytophthora kernoviae]RLN76701.1 hypothetical protein BBO99_00007343 [Phytophthora kernoviae]
MLRQAQLDVVVYPELGMDEWTVLLSHHRIAPVQCVFWGHPITSGFQALLGLADVILDPFPFGGGVTTLDALHLGVPVITLPAAQSIVHLAAGFLRYMNASDCIAKSLDDYVARAVTIATDPKDIRTRLLEHRSSIYQDATTIDDWNEFLSTVGPREHDATTPSD